LSTNLDNKLVIAISSRALFDLSESNQIFETDGLIEYTKYQFEHEVFRSLGLLAGRISCCHDN